MAAEHPAACTCDPALWPNVTDARCPRHGVAAFIRSLPADTDDETDGIEVDDGFGI